VTLEVVIATKNEDKIPEIEAVLAAQLPDLVVVRGLDWADVEETGTTLEDNALLKAEAVVEATGRAAIADDTGLEVDALGGAPGVTTARFAGPDATYAENRAAMLAALADVEDRRARFRTAAAFLEPGGRRIIVSGELPGRISLDERGAGGFGYDSIFELDDGRTLAEVGEGEKNRISHRARALEALATELRAAGYGAELP
jgi:XTP/dITP diphosphohydrolase